MIFEQSPGWREGIGHEGILVRGIPGREDSTYKVPEAGVSLAYSENSKEASVAKMEPAMREQ